MNVNYEQTEHICNTPSSVSLQTVSLQEAVYLQAVYLQAESLQAVSLCRYAPTGDINMHAIQMECFFQVVLVILTLLL